MSEALYEIEAQPGDIESPVLVVGLEGWIDAGVGAATAMGHLLSVMKTEVVARFDGDALIDYRARRPTLRVEDGLNAGLTWPATELQAGQDRTGRWLLVLTGPEPDMRWNGFTDAVVELAGRFDTELVCGLGAFPAPVPHTRHVHLASTATNRLLAEQVGFVHGTIEVPAGIQAALEQGFSDAGIDAVGMWARVPHYVAAMPYPAASAALLDGLNRLADLDIDTRELHAAAALTNARIDELIANSDEHAAMVRQLESTMDEAEISPLDPTELPSGDELAAELERFLRGEPS